METLIIYVAYKLFLFLFVLFCFVLFFIHLAPGSNLASVRISPVQDRQVWAKLVAFLIQTSLVILFYK